MPDQWLPLFDDVELKVSYRALAARAGLEYTAARRVLLGLGTTHETIAAVARAFEVHPDEVYRLRGEPPVRPFTLPDDAGRLNQVERDAVLAVVNAILGAKGESNAVEVAPESDAQTQGGQAQKIDSPDNMQSGLADDPIGDEIIDSANPDVDDRDDGMDETG